MVLTRKLVLEVKLRKMKIDIELSKGDCIKLLEQNGYNTIKKVLGYWYTDERNENFKKLCSCYVECAFQGNEKPSFLKEEYPLIDDVRKHSVETVVTALFNQKLLQLININ